jgi:hypothetical protein
MAGAAAIIRRGRAVYERNAAVFAVPIDAAIELEIDLGVGPQDVGTVQTELIAIDTQPVGHRIVTAGDRLM